MYIILALLMEKYEYSKEACVKLYNEAFKSKL